MYVVGDGREAHRPYSYISIVDTTQSKKTRDIKINTNWLETLALDRATSRLFVNMTAENSIGVINRNHDSPQAKWSIPADTQENLPLLPGSTEWSLAANDAQVAQTNRARFGERRGKS